MAAGPDRAVCFTHIESQRLCFHTLTPGEWKQTLLRSWLGFPYGVKLAPLVCCPHTAGNLQLSVPGWRWTLKPFRSSLMEIQYSNHLQDGFCGCGSQRSRTHLIEIYQNAEVWFFLFICCKRCERQQGSTNSRGKSKNKNKNKRSPT